MIPSWEQSPSTCSVYYHYHVFAEAQRGACTRTRTHTTHASAHTQHTQHTCVCVRAVCVRACMRCVCVPCVACRACRAMLGLNFNSKRGTSQRRVAFLVNPAAVCVRLKSQTVLLPYAKSWGYSETCLMNKCSVCRVCHVCRACRACVKCARTHMYQVRM